MQVSFLEERYNAGFTAKQVANEKGWKCSTVKKAFAKLRRGVPVLKVGAAKLIMQGARQTLDVKSSEEADEPESFLGLLVVWALWSAVVAWVASRLARPAQKREE